MFLIQMSSFLGYLILVMAGFVILRIKEGFSFLEAAMGLSCMAALCFMFTPLTHSIYSAPDAIGHKYDHIRKGDKDVLIMDAGYDFAASYLIGRYVQCSVFNVQFNRFAIHYHTGRHGYESRSEPPYLSFL